MSRFQKDQDLNGKSGFQRDCSKSEGTDKKNKTVPNSNAKDVPKRASMPTDKTAKTNTGGNTARKGGGAPVGQTKNQPVIKSTVKPVATNKPTAGYKGKEQAINSKQKASNTKQAVADPKNNRNRDGRNGEMFDAVSEKEYQESIKKEEMEERARIYYDHIQRQMLLEQLKKATRTRNRQQLESLVEKFGDSQIEDHQKEIAAARNMIEVLECRDRLITASKQKLVTRIEEILEEIEERSFVPYLQPEMQQAKHVLFVIAKSERSKRVLPKLESSTIAEIRAYKHPPVHVHRVIRAVLLLLGELEDRTDDWKECQKLCVPQGAYSLSRRLFNLDIEQLHPQIVARAKILLNKVDLNEIQDTSTGITAFYVWANGIIEEFEYQHDLSGVEPANRAMQRELLPTSPLSSPRKWNVIGDRAIPSNQTASRPPQN